MARRPLKKPEVPNTPATGEDGYMGALMTARGDDEELLYAGTNTKAVRRDFSATDTPKIEKEEE